MESASNEQLACSELRIGYSSSARYIHLLTPVSCLLVVEDSYVNEQVVGEQKL